MRIQLGALLIFILALTACGQKGPLVLPQPTVAPVATSQVDTENTEQVKKKTDQDNSE